MERIQALKPFFRVVGLGSFSKAAAELGIGQPAATKQVSRMGRLADSTLGARLLGLNPWVMLASPDYLKRCGTPQSPQDLADHQALIYSTLQDDARWHFGDAVGQTQSVAVRD